MVITSKLYLCNFTLLNVYEIFFFHVNLQKQPVFTSFPVFIKLFFAGKYIKNQDQEIARCCLDCKEKKNLSTSYSEESNDYFDNLKKNLIPYFYDINRHNNKGASNV